MELEYVSEEELAELIQEQLGLIQDEFGNWYRDRTPLDFTGATEGDR